MTGKRCVLLGGPASLAEVIGEHLRRAGADVVSGEDYTAPVHAIIHLAIPPQDGGFGSASLNDFRRIVDEHYVRTFAAMKAGLPSLRSAGGGTFITVTSVDGQHGAPDAAARCAVSQGLVLMTKSAALEYAVKPDNIRINALLVGDIVGPRDRKVAAGHVSAESIASSLCYLVSDAASYLTGVILPVENGAVWR